MFTRVGRFSNSNNNTFSDSRDGVGSLEDERGTCQDGPALKYTHLGSLKEFERHLLWRHRLCEQSGQSRIGGHA